MSELEFESKVLSLAQKLEYPNTPNIAGPVMARLRPSPRPRFVSKALAWSVTVLLVLVFSLMLIPPARAAILEFIQIGVVRIFPTEATSLPPPTQQPSGQVPSTATAVPTMQPLIPILQNLAGETTLEEAQKIANYPILLPAYPPNLGKPDYVFVQDAAGAVTILVWINPQKPDQVLMSLHFIPAGSWAIKKMEPRVIEQTSVNGHPAAWTTGPYIMRLINGDFEFTRLIDGHVLIWEDNNITYRLETALDLKEAIKIAESLEPIR